MKARVILVCALIAGGITASATGDQADSSARGRIEGRAVFSGPPPTRDLVNMTSDPMCVQQAGSMVESQTPLVDAKGGLQNVFVYIRDGVDSPTYDVPTAPVVLDQRGCQYSPRVLGVRVGQRLEILNSDPALHNTHGRPAANREFNIGQPIQGMRYTHVFTQPEVMVPLESDVHRWMAAFVGVMAHPFFAVSGPDGSFTIAGVPPGRYTLEAWHERFGSVTRTVTVDRGQVATVSLTFEAR